VQSIAAWKNMTSKRNAHESLESQLKVVALLLMIAFTGLATWLMLLLEFSYLEMATVFTLVLVPVFVWLWSFYHKIVTPFYSLTSLVEAIRLEDYSLRARGNYHSGIIYNLNKEISELSDVLQHRKQQYDQHTLLIYHLIEQLDAPIAIFNHKLQLSHANAAFSDYIGQPWEIKRLTASSRLGLALSDDNQWGFIDAEQESRWQIKHSHFIEDENKYHLVILTNIETLLRKNQQESWQQIIRVLSHEIRNSLTPIKSLAQSLVEMPNQEARSSQALKVIVQRSIELQAFVNRYSDITKYLSVNKQWLMSHEVIDPVVALFPLQDFTISIHIEKIWADPLLIKQVLINLVKNAVEASHAGLNESDSSKNIEINVNLVPTNQHISAKQNAQQNIMQKDAEQNIQVLIEVIDQGQGIANPQNLFVPFYTTKKQGHGIGLGLCQNIIDHHGGHLTLTNNKNSRGATARIILPNSTPALI
jgi:nitrogen fixation/metabolism regulation signal transduction histidine kinase